MPFDLPFGINVANTDPVDFDRYVKNTIGERDALIAAGRAYSGLQVYVLNDTTPANNGLWILTDIGGPTWLQISDTGGVIGGAVDSVFGRTGAVVAVEGDYDLGQMGDVDTTTTPPTNNQVLSWNGTNWVPTTAAAGVTQIDDLTDVDTTTTPPTSGQFLSWNGVDNWVPQTAPAGVTDIDDLSDVDTSTNAPNSGEVLTWNGVDNWVPASIPPSGGSPAGTEDIQFSNTAGTAFTVIDNLVTTGPGNQRFYYRPNFNQVSLQSDDVAFDYRAPYRNTLAIAGGYNAMITASTNNDVNTGRLVLLRATATGSPAAGTTLGIINSYSLETNIYGEGPLISFVATNDPPSSVGDYQPGEIQFATTDDEVNRSVTRMTIKEDGGINFANLPSGTTQPGGLASGDLWRDTTDDTIKIVP